MSLFIPKLEYSRTLEALPFSHPKQLVEVLPVLRQYAHITSLLKTCFYEAPKKQVPTHKLGHHELTPSPPPPHKAAQVGDLLPGLQLDVNLSYAPPVPRFTLHVPHPRAAVAAAACSSEKEEKKKSKDANDAAMIADLLSHLDEPSTTSSSPPPPPPSAYHAPLALAIDVQANGELVLTEQNVVLVEEEDDDTKVKRLARALDVVDDLGVWAEWLRLEVGKEEEERERKKSV
jgi:hypothetical protein